MPFSAPVAVAAAAVLTNQMQLIVIALQDKSWTWKETKGWSMAHNKLDIYAPNQAL